MPRTLNFSEATSLLRSTAQILEVGTSERQLRDLVVHGVLHRVRRGWFVRGDTWRDLWPEGRELLHVVAVHRDSRGVGSVFSHSSAAALWGLPLYRVPHHRVHTTVPGSQRSRSAPDVLRHEGALREDEIVERGGIRCTSLERTVLDVARTVSAEAGVACADAALRSVFTVGRAYDMDGAQRWRAEMSEVAARSRARGIRAARRVIAFADGRAQLPGESVSRLQLARLGFRDVDLQVVVPGPAGEEYRVDFGLHSVPALGEFDGEGKYTDPALRGGLSAEDVVLREKRREDWIRGVTRRPLVRWGYAHIGSPESLGQRLASFGVRPPRG